MSRLNRRNVERVPSEEEMRMANVKRNLREPGRKRNLSNYANGDPQRPVSIPRLENG